MRKYLLTAITGTLFIIGLTSMATLAPLENKNCNTFCDGLIELGIFESKGACMSVCNTCNNPGQGNGHFAVCVCNLMDDLNGGLEAFGFNNMGECVTTISGN